MSESKEAEGTPKDRWRWLRHLLLPLILLSMIPLLEAGVEENSPTSDEWAHFVRGVSYWTTGDTKLSFAHPPLANAIAGLPFLFEPDVPDLREFEHWEEGFVIGVYTEYTRIDYDRARAQLVRARRMMFVFPLALVAYVYWFCLGQFGWRTAIAASLMLAYNPNVLAHGSLVTTDLPAALGYVLATGEFVRYLRSPPSWWRVLSLGLAVSAAILFKHSGVLVIPALGLLGLGAAIKSWGVFAGADRRQRALRYLGNVGATALIAVVLVNAGYRFQHTGMRVDELLAKPEPQYWISKPYEQQMLEKLTPLDRLPGAMRIPLPYTQVFGLTAIKAQNKRGWFRSYFWGKPRSNKGHPLYFPVLLAVKTPLPVFALVLLGLVLRRPRRGWPTPPTLIVGLMLAYFVAMLVRSNLNMGFRHMMPAVPLLTILAGRGFAVAWDWAGLQTQARRRAIELALAGSLAIAPIVAVVAAPDYLGWFNGAVGRERGHWISIIGEDWNQDLLRAVRFAEAHELQPLYVVEHTTISKRELQWSGVPYRALDCEDMPEPGSWVLLRAAVAKTRRDKCHQWVEGRAPAHVIHDHMYLYRIEPEPEPGPEPRP